MYLLEAFRAQLVLFLLGALVHGIRCYFDEDREFEVLKHRGDWVLIVVIWFVLGTWARYYFQWPLLGVWSHLS